MKKLLQVLGVAVGLLFAGNVHAADVYTIDASHSSVGFSVKHLMVSTVTGTFDKFEGTITYDPADLAAFKSDVTIQASSIDTHVEKRDDHLRGPDFFDVAKFPTVTFTAKTLTGKDGVYTLEGDLAMHGFTKTISIPVTIAGPVKNPMGEGMILGFDGKATIDRQDFGIAWNKTLDNNGLAVGNNVDISINIEAHKK